MYRACTEKEELCTNFNQQIKPNLHRILNDIGVVTNEEDDSVLCKTD